LKKERMNDLVLIDRQNELLGRMEREVEEGRVETVGRKECECYVVEQYRERMRGLEMKIGHLEEEKAEFKREIRELVVQQERLKQQLQLEHGERRGGRGEKTEKAEKEPKKMEYNERQYEKAEKQYEKRVEQYENRGERPERVGRA
jgi:hypothetical protein